MKKTMLAVLVLTAAALGVAAYLAFNGNGRSTELPASCDVNDPICIRMATLVAGVASPGEAFAAFEASMEQDPSLRQTCHASSHLLGTVIWLRFGESSFVPGGGACAFGVYHGILQQIARDTPGELRSKAESLCGVLAAENTAQGEECIHGIGHALALVVDSLNDAYLQCEPLGSVNTEKCNQGATMEWVARFWDEIPYPTEVCAGDILPSALGDCVNVTYFEELVRHRDRLDSAGCDRFAPEVARECIIAIGTALAIYASGASDPMPYFEHPLCEPSSDCVQAMMVSYLMDQGTTEGGEAICRRLTLVDDCLVSVETARKLNRALDGGR
jgi:hypothetical protein